MLRIAPRAACSIALLAIVVAAETRANAQELPAAGAEVSSDLGAPTRSAVRPDPSAGDLATARIALRDGLALRDRGELQAALGRFTTAYELVPTPVTAFELGKAYMRLGRVLTAHELFQKVTRMPPATEESSRSAIAREESRRLAADLEPRIPTLRLRVRLPSGATADVRLDDEPIGVAGDAGGVTTRAVDPGAHVVTAKAGDGPEHRVTLEIGESETREVELAPQWIAPKAAKTIEPPSSSQVVFLRQTNPLVFVGFGASAAALTLTGVSAVLLVNAADRVQERCGKDYCAERVREKDLNETGTWALVTGISGVAAIGFFALGVISIGSPTNEKVVARGVTPYVGPGAAGIRGHF